MRVSLCDWFGERDWDLWSPGTLGIYMIKDLLKL